MLLSELKWKAAACLFGLPPPFYFAKIFPEKGLPVTIFRFTRKDTYSIYLVGDINRSVCDIDALTAQALLFEILKVTPK